MRLAKGAHSEQALLLPEVVLLMEPWKWSHTAGDTLVFFQT